MNLIYLREGLIFLFIVVINAEERTCPGKCACRQIFQPDGPPYMKLRCGDTDKIFDLDEINLTTIATELVQLNLSGNSLTSFNPKIQLIALQKLDLSKNHLAGLENDQFVQVPHLRRLDLSENGIKIIASRAFSELQHLERLKLSQNQISSIALGTFDPLLSLKQLDISSNPLTCDCGLLWLLDWSQKNSIKLVSNPKCSMPPSFKGLPLRKLKVGVDIHCRSPGSNSGLTMIELKPNKNQVVFEGDSLALQCKAPSISDIYGSSSSIEWMWLGSDPKSYFTDITIDSENLQSAGIIDSTLKITKLRRHHMGIWSCVWISLRGNYSKGITVVVISDDTHYCPITSTSNNKGSYIWPRTVVNYTATVPCESPNLNYDISLQKASYFCSEDGLWEKLNTSACSYTSETTRILEQFSKVNSSIMESAKHFKNYTSNLKHFVDVMDVVFAVRTMENYLRYLAINQIGGILIDIVNNLLELPKKYLTRADRTYGICPKLVNITERLAAGTATSLLHKSNIAVEIFQVKKYGFMGLKCTWYVDVVKPTDRLFYCVTNSLAETSDLRGKVTEASITIPESLFQQHPDHDPTVKFHNILISMWANSKLFPLSETRETSEIKSAVIGAKLVDRAVGNLSDPIFVMLRTPSASTYPAPTFTPAWWNPDLNNKSGGWSTQGCKFSHEYQDYVIFYCHNFGYYGLLQETAGSENIIAGAKFKFSHPAIYVGSLILFASLLVVILTYLLCYRAIQMPKKAKHSLINMWMAICLLCFMYVFGIYQTEDRQVCQIVGMLLHYFTLSSLLWMCVGVNCMYNRLSKNDVLELQDDELISEEPIKKPIAGLYFVGWGVAIIVCGISAAINVRDYASPTYCFLRTGPPLSALYIPFAILLFFLGIFFLLIRCMIYNLDATGHLSEGTQATENVDLDLLEPNFPNTDSRSVPSVSTKTASTDIEDPEHSPAAQLKSYLIFLLIYVLSWLSCAFATAQPYGFVSFEEDLFSIAYAIFATVLSAFTLFFYCVARSDVRTQWHMLGQWLRMKKNFGMVRTRNVSDAAQNVPQVQIQATIAPVSNSLTGDMQIISRSSSRTSSQTKSNSHTGNILKGAADLNGHARNDSQGAKINNVNLVVLHRQQYRSNVIPNIIENPTNAAEVFYNPHQSIVARKFFKRQKRHMLKRNNLAPRQRDLNSDNASVISDFKRLKDNSSMNQSLFGTNSKVNNTNIHVEHNVQRRQRKNLNLLSDSTEDLDLANNVPVQNIVLNAERLRRREISKHSRARKKYNLPIPKQDSVENNMRSVSQQCTLEYSSENISDSILDRNSPDKTNQSTDDLIEVISNVQESATTEDDCTFCQTEEPARNYDVEGAAAYINQMEVAPSLAGALPKIYVNPSHDLYLRQRRAQSRASSISVSDLDELYQQIRRGPRAGMSHSRTFSGSYALKRNSPCLSESDVPSSVNRRANRLHTSSDNVETTV